MGMYTSVLDEKDQEWQITAGNDCCDTYRIGDTVPQKVSDTHAGAGAFLDGVHSAYGPSYEGHDYEQGWVVIKDAQIAAVVPWTGDPGDHDGRAKRFQEIEREYGVYFNPRLWSFKLWAEQARRKRLRELAFHGWLADKHGVLPEEFESMPVMVRAELRANHAAEGFVAEIKRPSFSRQIFRVEPQDH